MKLSNIHRLAPHPDSLYYTIGYRRSCVPTTNNEVSVTSLNRESVYFSYSSDETDWLEIYVNQTEIDEGFPVVEFYSDSEISQSDDEEEDY